MTQQTYTPDWSKAPNDANWHARDSDGCGFWYNKRPAQSCDFWAAGCSLTIADNDCPVLDHIHRHTGGLENSPYTKT